MQSEINLEACRKKIDELDAKMMRLLVKRLALVRAVGKSKKESGLKIISKKRESEVINNSVKISGLRKQFLTKFYRVIFDEAYKLEK